MAVLFVFGLTIVLQITAAWMAFRLVRITGWRAPWMLIAAAILFTVFRRVIVFYKVIVGSQPHSMNMTTELLGLAVFLCFMIGIARIAPVFRSVRESERRIRHSHERLQSVLRTADHVAFIITDIPGEDPRVREFSPGAERIFGYRSEEILGRPVSALFRPRDARRLTKAMEALPDRSEGFDASVMLVRKSGEVFPALLTTRPLRDPADRVSELLGVCIDISDLKRSEKQRNRLIAELKARNTELEQFTASVSHDLKSPLITVQGFVSLLKRDHASGDEERFQQDLEHVEGAALRMQRLLDEVLELSRVGLVCEPADVIPLSELAREAAGLVSGRSRPRGVEIRVDPELPVVRVDRNRMVQVLQNLLDNAVKFMGEQPRPLVEVSCSPAKQELVFHVRDNGLGIAPEDHEKIFGLFEQLDSRSEGTGIGLALARRIVENHGGRLWVESQGIGRGTSFCFTLPADGAV